jgi:hypothetical protein
VSAAARVGLSVAGALALSLSVAAAARDGFHDAPPYLRPAAPGVTTSPIITSGARVPLTHGGRGATYVFPGIPDGMGGHATGRSLTLLVNHEIASSKGGASGAVSGGARISEITLSVSGAGTPTVVSARPGIRALHEGETGARVPDGTRRLTKLCSATMAGPPDGFDRWIYFTGEEDDDSTTFDRTGGSAFAVIDGHAYQFPRIGRAKWENIVPVRGRGSRTVLLAMEDADADEGDGLNAQLYMYVGTKQPRARDALAGNGLRGGRLYTFVTAAAAASESTITRAGESLHGRWVEVDASGDARALDRATRAAHAMRFVRIEDCAMDPVRPGNAYFTTTGDPKAVNTRGRMYHLTLDPRDPLAGATITILLDGSEGVLNPDNIDVNRHGEIAICEDPVQDMDKAGLTRDASVWIYDMRSRALTRVAEVDQSAAIAHARTIGPADSLQATRTRPGAWESSGIIDAEAWAGRGAWLVAVQAHTLRVQPVAETVQGGQLLLLRVAR